MADDQPIILPPAIRQLYVPGKKAQPRNIPHPSTRMKKPRWEMFQKSFGWGLPRRRRGSSVDGERGVSPKTRVEDVVVGETPAECRDEYEIPLGQEERPRGRSLECRSDGIRSVCEPHPGRRVYIEDEAEQDTPVIEDGDCAILEAKAVSPAQEYHAFLRTSKTVTKTRRKGSATQQKRERAHRSKRTTSATEGAEPREKSSEEDIFIFSAGPDATCQQPQSDTRKADGKGSRKKRPTQSQSTQTDSRGSGNVLRIVADAPPGSLSSGSPPPSTRENSGSSSQSSASSVEMCIAHIQKSFAVRATKKYHGTLDHAALDEEIEKAWALRDGEVMESSLGRAATR